MGRALARELAARGDSIFLLGRDPAELEKSAADLQARGAAAPVGTAPCDLSRPASFEAALDAGFEALAALPAGKDDAWAVVLTAGQFGTQEELESDRARCHELLVANYANSVLFLEDARKRLMRHGGGLLVGFSSVAGDRGRKPVALYGSTKAGLSHYLESLDHRYRADGLTAICVKPGFVKTSMTQGLQPPPFAGEPDDVARRVVRAMDRREPMVYAPAPWRWIMAIIKRLPRAVMRRVGF